MATADGVIAVHDLHVWSLNAERIALSAHIVTGKLEKWPDTLAGLKVLLAQRYEIEHVTLQPEIDEYKPSTAPLP